ncbi:MAG TPA: alpha/beta hydrolase [Acidimicrobiales bacterium]
MDERIFVDGHGVEVFTRSWPVDAPVGVVLVSHGASEHSGRYDRFARALNDAGFAVAALDHRGHGRTGAATGAGVMGVGGGQAVVDDLHQLRGEAEAAFPDTSVFLFGHSMGSLIGLAYLVQHGDGLAGSVLCGIPADVGDVAGVSDLLRAAEAAGLRDQPADALVEANAPFEPARTAFDWLSRDEDEVDRYVADPLCGDGNPLTYGYLIDLFDVLAPAGELLHTIRSPVLVIAGDQDPAAAMGAHATTLAEALRAAGTPVDLHLYQGARHELLNETNRDEVMADILDWLAMRR